MSRRSTSSHAASTARPSMEARAPRCWSTSIDTTRVRFVEGAVDVSKAGSQRAHQVRPGAVIRACRVGVERPTVIDDDWQ